MDKFLEPLASAGSRDVIPDAAKPDDSLSYADEWTAPYAVNPSLGGAKNLTQAQINGVLYDVTNATLELHEVAATISTIADLRLNDLALSVVRVLGYSAAGDLGGGVFWLDAADTTAADDGGMVIVDAAGQRWKRLTEVVDLRFFGAVGDDTTDNTTAVQNWLSYIAANDATGWVGDGVYQFGHVAVTIPAGGTLSVRGSGTLKLSDPSTVFGTYAEWISVSPTTSDTETLDIRDITIDGNSTKWTPGNYVTDTPLPAYNDAVPATGNWRGWFLLGSSDLAKLTVQNVTFLAWKRGVVVDSCRYVDFEGCWSDCASTIGQVLLAADLCENVTFADNQCLGFDYSAGASTFGIGTTSAAVVLPHGSNNVLIDGNTLYGHQVVVRPTDLSAVSGRRCIIANNVIDYPVADTAVYAYEHVVISNNVIRRSGDVGISTDESRYVTITGNSIDGCCAGGITSFNAIGLTVTGNAVRDVAQDYSDSTVSPSLSTAVGIWVTGTNLNPPNSFLQENITITGNTLVLTAQPPTVDPAAIVLGVFDNEAVDIDQTFVVANNVATVDAVVGPRFTVSAHEAIAYISASTGSPIVGEVLTGGTSGVSAFYTYHTGGGGVGRLFFAEPTGPFVNGETITAATSGAIFTAESAGGGTNPRWTGGVVRNNVDRFRQRAGTSIGTTPIVSKI